MANCPICNNQIPNNQTVCPYCETIINKPMEVKTKNYKRKFQHKIYLIMSAVVMVIAGFVGMLIYKHTGWEATLYLAIVIIVGIFNVGYGFKSGIVKALLIGAFHFVTVMLGYIPVVDLYVHVIEETVLTILLGICVNIINICFTMFLMNKDLKKLRVKRNVKKEDKEIERLKKYKELYDAGVITEQEFVAKKRQILGI